MVAPNIKGKAVAGEDDDDALIPIAGECSTTASQYAILGNAASFPLLQSFQIIHSGGGRA